MSGSERAGIMEAVTKELQKEDPFADFDLH